MIYPPPQSPLDGKLEPEARKGRQSTSEAALVSIAISLKRLADMAQPFVDEAIVEEPPSKGVGIGYCPGDGRPCHVGGDEPHWRCGTVQCGRP